MAKLMGIVRTVCCAVPLSLAFVSAAAGANEPIGAFERGTDLWAECSSPALEASCLAYIIGSMDQIATFQAVRKARVLCAAAGTTERQIRDSVFNYLRDHPNERRGYASGLVVAAMTKSFPCKR